MPLTTSSLSSPSPPWQLRWKRPRLDVVVDDCSSNDVDNNSSSAENDDKNNRIRDHWIPISTSSIVLTRYEARTVLDGLGVSRRRRDDDNPDVTTTRRGDKDTGVVKFSEKGEKNDEDSTHVGSHRNKNGTIADEKKISVIEGFFKSIFQPDRGANNDNQRRGITDAQQLSENENIQRQKQINVETKKWNGRMMTSSAASMTSTIATNDFNSPSIGGGTKVVSHLITTSDDCKRNNNDDSEMNTTSSPPTSPTSFSTFESPKRGERQDGGGGNNNYHDGGDSNNVESTLPHRRSLTEASAASSFLWGEDMSLTSVSEEDAAAIMKQGGRPLPSVTEEEEEVAAEAMKIRRHRQRRRHHRPTQRQQMRQREIINGRGANENVVTGVSDKQRCSSNVDDDQEWDDYYDHIVLSVTIFAMSTTGAAASSTASLPRRSDSSIASSTSWAVRKGGLGGEVIVMELLSTREQICPRINSSLEPNPSTDEDIVDDRANKVDGGRMTNHTRILVRRVLYWPSSILSTQGMDGSNGGGVNSDNRPSFVSLGRTNEWKENDDNDLDAVATGSDERNDTNNDKSDDEGVSCDKIGDNERAADALEAFQSLNFLFGGESTNIGGMGLRKAEITRHEKGSGVMMMDMQTSSNSSMVANKMAMKWRNETKKRSIQAVSMCLIGNDGQVHYFHALHVLVPFKLNNIDVNGNKKGEISNGFASLLFGEAMLAKVKKTVMPLSRPRASMRLSQIGRHQPSAITEEDGESDEELDGTNDINNINDENSDSQGSRGGQWGNLGIFDASLDPSTLHLCTEQQSNVITGSCITSDSSNGYLAICGRGLRRIGNRKSTSNGSRRDRFVLGGFVTFVSLRHCAESRTIYLPFAPESIQNMYWLGMHFVVLLGESEGPSNSNGSSNTLSRSNSVGSFASFRSTASMRSSTSQNQHRCRKPHVMAIRVDVPQSSCDDAYISVYPDRFKCLPMELPSIQESLGSKLSHFSLGGQTSNLGITSRAVSFSSISSSPPGLLLSFESDAALVVVNHSLLSVLSKHEFSISMKILPGRRALLGPEANRQKVDWCTGGQGWSLVGTTQGLIRTSYFICWDGASDDSQGPYILPLRLGGLLKDGMDSKCLTSAVIPLMSNIKYAQRLMDDTNTEVAQEDTNSIQFVDMNNLKSDYQTGLRRDMSFCTTIKEAIDISADIEGGIDDIIVRALDSLFLPNQPASPDRYVKSTDGGHSNRKKISMLSHKEKSLRLLQRCPKWTQLDDAATNHKTDGQVVIATVRIGTLLQSLTLRTNVAANPISTPSDQILSWLCRRRDYYTAACIALSLLDDTDTVHKLCRIPISEVSEEDNPIHHKGLLDGIQPLSSNAPEILNFFADMAVACLVKGGESNVLQGFLSRNTLYTASSASIMLVGTILSTLSKESVSVPEMITNECMVDLMSTIKNQSDDMLWPIQCLMKMAVVRKCLPFAIMMLNKTIPNELRWRAPPSQGLSSFPRPSMGFFLGLLKIILESTEAATRCLLNTIDEESGFQYWFSITDDTRLVLCLLKIEGRNVMLLEPEVRAWVLTRLKEEIESPTDFTSTSQLLSNRWLVEVVTGAFVNAGCDKVINSIPKTEHGNEDTCYRHDMEVIRRLIVKQNDYFGLDFDLVIAAMLILVSRRCDLWKNGEISTQTLLNAFCDMAGRKRNFETNFIFDGATVMRLCALADNLQAAAFLIGGKHGLIIECGCMLVSSLEMSIEDAEIALYNGSLVDLRRLMIGFHDQMAAQHHSSTFVPSEMHYHLLWLLEHYVLDIKSYGEFDSTSHTVTQDKLTPVFTGRVCLRAWYSLTHPSNLSSSVEWLEKWLRQKVDLTSGSQLTSANNLASNKSTKRLACAALVHTLLWADEVDDLDLNDADDEDQILCKLIGFNLRFISELAEACCGLIQSIPPNLADELTSSLDGNTNLVSFDSSIIDGGY